MSDVNELIEFISSLDGKGNKNLVSSKVEEKFGLNKDRSVFFCDSFAIRFCYSSGKYFNGTVVGLSKLKKFDNLPFIVCLVRPQKNEMYIANSTFITKLSHTSHKLSIDNIKGSFNGSDILKELGGITNQRDNILKLYPFHCDSTFEENLSRLVDATGEIIGKKKKILIDDDKAQKILDSVDKAILFNSSIEFIEVEKDLNNRIDQLSNEIFKASQIENVNIRGRLIEYLITENNSDQKQMVIEELNKEHPSFESFKTENLLGDYKKSFENFNVEIDVKSKLTYLNSNPKAYNIDKILEFLSLENSVFLFFFIGIDEKEISKTNLVSVFQEDLLKGTICQKHWAGKNTRGVTQFLGRVVDGLLSSNNQTITKDKAQLFLSQLIYL